MSSQSTCRSCGHQIVWLRNPKTGKNSPVNANVLGDTTMKADFEGTLDHGKRLITGIDYASGPDRTGVCLRRGKEVLAIVHLEGQATVAQAVAACFKAAGLCTACGETYAKCLCY